MIVKNENTCLVKLQSSVCFNDLENPVSITRKFFLLAYANNYLMQNIICRKSDQGCFTNPMTYYTRLNHSTINIETCIRENNKLIDTFPTYYTRVFFDSLHKLPLDEYIHGKPHGKSLTIHSLNRS